MSEKFSTDAVLIAELESRGYVVTKRPDQKTCKHLRMRGTGSIRSDGYSKSSGYCPDCGYAYDHETPADPNHNPLQFQLHN